MFQHQLKNEEQRPSETMQQYDTAQLISLAFPTAPKYFLDCVMVQIFIIGIHYLEIGTT